MLKKIRIILFCYLGLVSCSESKDDKHASTLDSASCTSAFSRLRLSQLARKFAKLSALEQSELASSLKEGMHHVSGETSSRDLSRLIAYFSDLSKNERFALDGSSTPFTPISTNVIRMPSPQYSKVKPNLAWPTLSDPLWNGLLIPQHMMVKNYPLFRGDATLLASFSYQTDLVAKDSRLWKDVHDLFENGKTISDKNFEFHAHKDVYEHTLDSSSSFFLSSSKDMMVAQRFGKRPSSPWSAVIEFRGEGIDVASTSHYFENFEFLLPGKVAYPDEKEVAVAFGIEAKKIRGVWLYHVNGKVIFIENPNYIK